MFNFVHDYYRCLCRGVKIPVLIFIVHCKILACAGTQVFMTAQSSITTVKINIQSPVREAEGPKDLEIHWNPICVYPFPHPEALFSAN